MTSTAIDTQQPSAALALSPGQMSWTKQQEAGLAQIGLADASDGDRAVFLHQCQRTGLDPFARQIYMIPRREKVPGTRDQWRTKWTIQTGIDGFRVNRARAERNAGARGVLSRPVFYDGDGNAYPVWVRRDPPAACEVTYTVRDANGETPYTSVLLFREYCQTNGDGNLTGQWAVKGAHMLEKCTEADVYRKAFPQDFSGIHLDDAMPAPEPQPEQENGRQRGRVTAGEVLDRKPANGSGAAPSGQPAGQEPAAAPEQLLKVIADHFDRLSITEADECLTWTSKLAGREITAPDQLAAEEAKTVASALWKCQNLGDLTALTTDGEKPGGESDA
jgi:phage recombination protein Bet